MRILIAIDGSPHSGATLRLGAQIAHRVDEPLTVLTVIKNASDHPMAQMILDRARGILQPQVPVVATKVRVGDPIEQIIREAQEGSYDLVIVGERTDRNWLTRFLRGSAAVSVGERAPCPVIVTKGHAGPIQRILLCDSGVQSPSELSGFTSKLAELLDGEQEVTVLHVMSQVSAGPTVNGKHLRATVETLIEEHTPEGELLERDVEVLKRPGIHPRPTVRRGLVVDEIVKDVRRESYDLVVIGAHRGEKWQRILLDDLAHKILVKLDRPVLIVR